jgi:hypothetical protein
VKPRQAARPTGWAPPAEAWFGSARVELIPLAREVSRRHLERHPEDLERYGELAEEWAVHDMQHVLHWAFGDFAGLVELATQVGWLARVLGSRDYPVENLWSCLRTAAEVVEERVDGGAPVAARLREVAAQ